MSGSLEPPADSSATQPSSTMSPPAAVADPSTSSRDPESSTSTENPPAASSSTEHPAPATPAKWVTGAVAQDGSPPPEIPGFVRPSSYLRPRVSSRQQQQSASTATAGQQMQPQQAAGMLAEGMLTAIDREQMDGLIAIRAFLKVRTSYDVLPLSFRLIMFDTALLVKKSLNILIQNAIVSAPLWDSKTSTFAGLLTTSDYINVVQYYWQNPDALAQIDQFRLDSLPKIEQALGVAPIETISIHPSRPLYEACLRMLQSRARRIPLVDVDDETQRAMVVSVVTQYRILKFVAANVRETEMLRKPIGELRLGTYTDLATATLDTPVMDVIHMLVKKNISSVPILDREGIVINVFEAVDVIVLIKGGVYEDLNLSVGEALLKRPDDFPGIYTCSPRDRLDALFDTLRKSRVHRFVILDDAGKLKGVLTLSDILDYVILTGKVDA